MNHFIPPYPHRHTKSLSALETLNYARLDLLSIWTEKNFQSQFSKTKLINKPIFIANCPEVVSYVLIENPANYQRKSALMRKALEPLLGSSIFISESALWQKQRANLEILFAKTQFAHYAQVIIDATSQFVENWQQLDNHCPVLLLPQMQKLSASIMTHLLFGRAIGIEQINQLVDEFNRYQRGAEQIDIGSFFGLPAWLNKKSKTKDAAANIHRIIDDLIAQGITENDKHSLLAQLLLMNNLSPVELRYELTGLFMAGYESFANTLTWAFYLIANSPHVEQDLIAELNAVNIDNHSAAQLVYTQAIIDETLRLYPPVPLLLREVSHDDVIRNTQVPAGSIMIIAPWLLHRHKLYWQSPDSFMPERFLKQAPTKIEAFTYLPFSAGARTCIANHLAPLQLTLSLAVLAKNFHLELAQGTVVTHECHLLLRPKGDVPMILTKR